MCEKEKVSKEQLILEAAEQEFFSKGYAGARTISIAEHAGVTHAMLHYYYRTKEQLFDCVVDKNISQIATTLLSVLGKPDMPLLSRLKESISTHFDLVANNPLLPRFVMNEIMTRPERCTMIYDKLMTRANGILDKTQVEIDEASKRGEIEWIDARMLFISILSLNIFPFVAYSFAEDIMNNLITNPKTFLEKRKAENINLIMKRITKR